MKFEVVSGYWVTMEASNPDLRSDAPAGCLPAPVCFPGPLAWPVPGLWDARRGATAKPDRPIPVMRRATMTMATPANAHTWKCEFIFRIVDFKPCAFGGE